MKPEERTTQSGQKPFDKEKSKQQQQQQQQQKRPFQKPEEPQKR